MSARGKCCSEANNGKATSRWPLAASENQTRPRAEQGPGFNRANPQRVHEDAANGVFLKFARKENRHENYRNNAFDFDFWIIRSRR